MRMNKIFFIVLEFFFAIGFGVLGSYIFSRVNDSDITLSILGNFIIAFFGMILGIAFIGFFQLSAIGKRGEFIKAIIYCFIGLSSFLILYLIINSLTFKVLPHYLSSVMLPILIPVTGAVIGFNYIVFRKV